VPPYKFDAERREEFLQLLRDGGRRMMSARAVGIDPRTVQRYIANHDNFRHAVREAEMEANEVVEDALFQTATSGNVTAMLAWLYNRDPDQWADRRQMRTEHTGAGGGPVEVQTNTDVSLAQAVLEDPEARDLARQLLRRARQPRDRSEA
jgi:hypothetical protein